MDLPILQMEPMRLREARSHPQVQRGFRPTSLAAEPLLRGPPVAAARIRVLPAGKLQGRVATFKKNNQVRLPRESKTQVNLEEWTKPNCGKCLKNRRSSERKAEFDSDIDAVNPQGWG